MKVLILYRPKSEHARRVEEFVHDFERHQTNRKINTLSLDTRDGAATATLYGIVSYPAFLALADDGQLLKSWEGENLPLMNDLAFYSHS